MQPLADRIRLLLVLLVAAPCRAGELPDPLFWGSEARFLEQVTSGQFDRHLELHLVQYSADPRWRSDWAARRYAGNGLFGEYGSTTARDLFVNSQIALNLFPLESLQVRYDRRDYQDGRFDVADQRFDVVWYAGTGWGVVVSGWPTHQKQDASMGAGIRLGAPRSANGLVVQVVDDRFLWNEKSEDSLRFTRDPVRLLADGYLESGAWRFSGSIDYGLTYEAVETPTGEATPLRSTRGSQQFADVSVGYVAEGWSVSGRVTAASLEREETDSWEPAPSSLERSWGRFLVELQKGFGDWNVYGRAGYSFQRDRFSSPSTPDGSYRMDAALFGIEGGRRIWKGLELRLGYLGSVQKMVRTLSQPGPLAPGEESGYVDKAHLRALYSFQPQLSVEFLVSQTVNGSSFGGGSVKARLVF